LYNLLHLTGFKNLSGVIATTGSSSNLSGFENLTGLIAKPQTLNNHVIWKVLPHLQLWNKRL